MPNPPDIPPASQTDAEQVPPAAAPQPATAQAATATAIAPQAAPVAPAKQPHGTTIAPDDDSHLVAMPLQNLPAIEAAPITAPPTPDAAVAPEPTDDITAMLGDLFGPDAALSPDVIAQALAALGEPAPAAPAPQPAAPAGVPPAPTDGTTIVPDDDILAMLLRNLPATEVAPGALTQSSPVRPLGDTEAAAPAQNRHPAVGNRGRSWKWLPAALIFAAVIGLGLLGLQHIRSTSEQQRAAREAEHNADRELRAKVAASLGHYVGVESTLDQRTHSALHFELNRLLSSEGISPHSAYIGSMGAQQKLTLFDDTVSARDLAVSRCDQALSEMGYDCQLMVEIADCLDGGRCTSHATGPMLEYAREELGYDY